VRWSSECWCGSIVPFEEGHYYQITTGCNTMEEIWIDDATDGICRCNDSSIFSIVLTLVMYSEIHVHCRQTLH
jgi:hypothetical protein